METKTDMETETQQQFEMELNGTDLLHRYLNFCKAYALLFDQDDSDTLLNKFPDFQCYQRNQ